MIAVIKSCGVTGIDGYIVEVEADMQSGMPGFDIVGLPDIAIRESKERVKSAIANCGFRFPSKKTTINLAPAHIKKIGAFYDLPISIGILKASEQISCPTDDYLFVGELSLGGDLRSVNGALSMALTAREQGIKNIILPKCNCNEAVAVEGVNVYGAENLKQIIDHLCGVQMLEKAVYQEEETEGMNQYTLDFSDVMGQEMAKQALIIAAAGGHSCLMIGPPGSGKTMLAQRLPTILPPMEMDEAIETTKIHSVAGVMGQHASLIKTRPFRNPHHTSSAICLTGGGSLPKPGELSLAHNGVLFLDEFPEFRKDALEAMRQPLEDGKVTVSRVNSTAVFPCNVMLIAAMNPCYCGYYGSNVKQCTCQASQIHRYLSKISGPILDRIDMQIEVSALKYSDLNATQKGESSESIRKRVAAARAIQKERYQDHGIHCNAQLKPKMMKEFCALGETEKAMMKNIFERLALSARAHDKILKVARTIADMEQSQTIGVQHIAQAVMYRSLDKRYRDVEKY